MVIVLGTWLCKNLDRETFNLLIVPFLKKGKIEIHVAHNSAKFIEFVSTKPMSYPRKDCSVHSQTDNYNTWYAILAVPSHDAQHTETVACI